MQYHPGIDKILPQEAWDKTEIKNSNENSPFQPVNKLHMHTIIAQTLNWK